MSITQIGRGRASSAVFAALAIAILATEASAQQAPASAHRLGAVAQVRSWGYQLQNLDVGTLAASPYDVLVIDYSRDGSEEGRLRPADLQRLKTKPDGSLRVILCYMSIGEAETYRYYWNWLWGGRWYTSWLGWLFAPSWLAGRNKEWGGNHAVRYWDPRWKALILGKDGYLDRVLEAGFDGVWLDKVDSSLEEVARGRPSAKQDMQSFVAEIADRGRKARPGFLVVPQNGEELLVDASYRRIIDAIGKEDLLYGEFDDRKPNPADVIQRRTALLKELTAEAKPVLAVEYIDNAGHVAGARKTLTAEGFVPHFAERSLGSLRVGDLPSGTSGSGRPRGWSNN